MSRYLVWIALSLTFSLPVDAALSAELRDPTRPAGFAEKPKASKKRISYTLNSILYSRGRRMAVINGQILAEGDRIGDARVSRISERSVDLERQGRSVTLSLKTAKSVRK